MAEKKVPELDLHGYSVTEAITRFVEWYDEHHVAADGAPRGRLKVIHGWGSTGVGGGIGEALSKLLDQNLDRLAYFSPHDNMGVTIVQPHAMGRLIGLDRGGTEGNLVSGAPQREDPKRQKVAALILKYCADPRQERRLIAKYCRYGDSLVRSVIRDLLVSGELTCREDGGARHYAAVACPPAASDPSLDPKQPNFPVQRTGARDARPGR